MEKWMEGLGYLIAICLIIVFFVFFLLPNYVGESNIVNSDYEGITVEELERKPDTEKIGEHLRNLSRKIDIIQACFDASNFTFVPALITSFEENLSICYALSDEYADWYLDAYAGTPMTTTEVFQYTDECDSLRYIFYGFVDRYNRILELELI